MLVRNWLLARLARSASTRAACSWASSTRWSACRLICSSCGRGRRTPRPWPAAPPAPRREDVVDGAQRVAALGVGVVGEGREEDDRRVLGPLALADERGRLEAIEPRHVHVEQDDREVVDQQAAQALRRPRRPRRPSGRGSPARPRWPAASRHVVDEQDLGFGRRVVASCGRARLAGRPAFARGRRVWKIVPGAASMHFSRSPFMALAVTATIGRFLKREIWRMALHRVDAVHLRHHDVHQHDVDVRATPAAD